ncbi:RAF-like serine/threonine-protein kinase PRAF [Bidens hawaiensis]|uniref:RAF-like serine/threonine-protein kinase PRAF n=1 Tax=Bidens hawaiensis TaxID=980011 RepID=UPI00404B4AB1
MVGPTLNAPKPPTNSTIKLLCSYGGRILPRYPDGKLRYHGGQTRVLAVPRSISFSELVVKLGELCGKTVSLRCQLPTEDLDALVSITSDEDLTNLVEEYDRTACLQPSPLKIRAFLSVPKKCSPSPTHSTASGSGCGSSSSTGTPDPSPRYPVTVTNSKPPLFCYNKSVRKVPYHAYRNTNINRCCVVPNGSQWQ